EAGGARAAPRAPRTFCASRAAASRGALARGAWRDRGDRLLGWHRGRRVASRGREWHEDHSRPRSPAAGARRERARCGAKRRRVRTHRDGARRARLPRVRTGVRRAADGGRPRRGRQSGRCRRRGARTRAPGAASARPQPFFRMIRTAFTLLVFGIFTIICGLMGLAGALLGLRDGVGSIFDYAMRLWGTAATWASGVEVVVHGRENVQ